jgi:hypothetical protein
MRLSTRPFRVPSRTRLWATPTGFRFAPLTVPYATAIIGETCSAQGSFCMVAHQLSAEEARAEMEREHARDMEAFARIEARFPGYTVVLVRRDLTPARIDVVAAPTPAGTRMPTGEDSTRRRVAQFASRGWVTQAQIVEATSLTKRQIYGAMDGKDGGPVFERRKIPGALHGEMEFRLKEPWDGIIPEHKRRPPEANGSAAQTG